MTLTPVFKNGYDNGVTKAGELMFKAVPSSTRKFPPDSRLTVILVNKGVALTSYVVEGMAEFLYKTRN